MMSKFSNTSLLLTVLVLNIVVLIGMKYYMISKLELGYFYRNIPGSIWINIYFGIALIAILPLGFINYNLFRKKDSLRFIMLTIIALNIICLVYPMR